MKSCVEILDPTVGYRGVSLYDLGDLERHFKIAITVYEHIMHPQLEREVCSLVRRGSPEYEDQTLFLDYGRGGHFSLITDMGRYSNTWTCYKCHARFNREYGFMIHASTHVSY